MRTRTLLALAIAVMTAAPASAQVPDERAAAQGLADAVAHMDAAWPDNSPTGQQLLDEPRCRREIRRLHPRVLTEANDLVLRQVLRQEAKRVEPVLRQFRSELAGPFTRDRALISGRAAWRRFAKAYMGLPRPTDLCGELAAWRRDGYDPAVPRAARVDYRRIRAASGPGFQRKVAAAADRMRALGVSEQDAQVFESDAGAGPAGQRAAS
jgi:hypothetical protein